MNSIKILIVLYFINLIKNTTDYDRVFKVKSIIYNRDNQDISKELQTTSIIKFFILSLFQILIIYLLLKDNDFEAKPLILISYGLAIPLYTIEYYSNNNLHTIDTIIYIIQCITSTLAIYLIWSKQTYTSGITISIVTLIIMLLPIIIIKLTNTNTNTNTNTMVEEVVEEVVEEEKRISGEDIISEETKPNQPLFC